MRVFLDANVLFSASRSESNIRRLLDWLFDEHTAVTSDLAVEEARKNLSLKRKAWIPGFESLIDEIELVPSVLFELPVTLESKDAPLLCSAIRSHCDLFVTGDRRDFGHLFEQTVQGVRVVSVLGLAETLAGSGATDSRN